MIIFVLSKPAYFDKVGKKTFKEVYSFSSESKRERGISLFSLKTNFMDSQSIVVPEGYMPAMNRAYEGDSNKLKSHLYKGDMDDPGKPMCQLGYNNDGSYSIWRNNTSEAGVCKTCLKRAENGLSGVDFDASFTRRAAYDPY